MGERIDALTALVADPVFGPGYWVKSRDAHTLVCHLDPATLVTEVASIRVVVAGVGVNVSKVADQDVYAFVFNAASSATITASAGNAGRDTVTAEVILRDRSNAELRRWRTVLRVLDEEPATGGGGPTYTPILTDLAVTGSSITLTEVVRRELVTNWGNHAGLLLEALTDGSAYTHAMFLTHRPIVLSSPGSAYRYGVTWDSPFAGGPNAVYVEFRGTGAFIAADAAFQSRTVISLSWVDY